MLTFRWMKDILLYGLYLIELITLSKFISTCILNVRITSSQKWSVCKYIFKTKLSLYDYLCDYFVESAGNFFFCISLITSNAYPFYDLSEALMFILCSHKPVFTLSINCQELLCSPHL